MQRCQRRRPSNATQPYRNPRAVGGRFATFACEMRGVLVLSLILVATPAAASAAALTTDAGCYQETGEVVLSGGLHTYGGRSGHA